MVNNLPSHIWWCYVCILGKGAKLVWDEEQLKSIYPKLPAYNRPLYLCDIGRALVPYYEGTK